MRAFKATFSNKIYSWGSAQSIEKGLLVRGRNGAILLVYFVQHGKNKTGHWLVYPAQITQ